jgi:hypothetical protein
MVKARLKKAVKPPNPFARKIIQTARFNADEMKTVLANAHTYTQGNVSEWLRYAALHFKPGKGDLQK